MSSIARAMAVTSAHQNAFRPAGPRPSAPRRPRRNPFSGLRSIVIHVLVMTVLVAATVLVGATDQSSSHAAGGRLIQPPALTDGN